MIEDAEEDLEVPTNDLKETIIRIIKQPDAGGKMRERWGGPRLALEPIVGLEP